MHCSSCRARKQAQTYYSRYSSGNFAFKGPSVINTTFCKRSHRCSKSRPWEWCYDLHCWLCTSSVTHIAFFVPIPLLLPTISDLVSISYLRQHVISPRLSVADTGKNQLGEVIFFGKNMWSPMCYIIR